MSPRSRYPLIAALVALGLAVGCAEERDPINRVQPNALPKKFFVGEKLLDASDDPEFWSQATLIDVGYGAAQDGLFTSTYAQPMSRVKFVIQEKQLIARLTYERIDDSDHKGMGPMSDDGIIVAVYPILSHFDIQREYNPVTGEEYNVIGENQSDRPWYEREYMRVDWSKNQNVDSYDFDTLSMLGIYGGVTYEPLAYYINDPTHPDAPHFSVEEGYFDVTNKAFAVPALIDLSMFDWGINSFPACYLENDFLGGSAPAGNCNPVELTIRHSFRRVVDTDYEPANWDGYRFKAYGAFYTERKGYARAYGGITDDRWYRFINRYDIWDLSHYYADPEKRVGEVRCFTPETTPIGADPHRDLLSMQGDQLVAGPNGTEDECEEVTKALGVGGSRCNEFTQKCTLPYRLRKPVTQVWYYTTGSDPVYFQGTDWAAQEWDVALRSAVMTARYSECMRAGGSRETCEQEWPIYRGQQDENEDAIALADEVDACRRGLAYLGRDCDEVADKVGAERGYSAGVIATAKMPEMIVLCHSPVEANDHPLCAPADERLPEGMTAADCHKAAKERDAQTLAVCRKARNARLGDLRYNQVNTIETPQTPSPWGIMVDSIDPYNGQTVATSINAWSFVTDMWVQSVIDIARYIKGELSTEQITNGEYIKDWSQAAQAAAGGGAAPLMSAREVDARISDFVGKDVSKITPQAARAVLGHPSLRNKIHEVNKRARSSNWAAHAWAVSSQAATYNARMHRAQNTAFEAQLITPMMVEYSGVTKLGSADVQAQFASPLRAANPSVLREMRRLRELALAERGACMLEEAPAPLSVANLADALERKFNTKFSAQDSKDVQAARAERMIKWMRQRVHESVIVHEMGHSVGLRHNFVSSADPYNYRPQYWSLRTLNGGAINKCTDVQTTEEGAKYCVGPRYFDPTTKDERDNLIWMWMQSSIMDYAGETTQDLLGLGAYDFAAARMFYGDTVAIYDKKDEWGLGTARATGLFDKMDSFGGIVGLQYSIYDPSCTDQDSACSGKTRSLHYSELQQHYKMVHACDPVDPTVFKPATWNEKELGPWDPLLDGMIVSFEGQGSRSYTRCKQEPVDYVQWSTLRFPTKEEAGEYYWGGPSIAANGSIRVPYGFATDNWADLGNLSVYRHDNGGDAYELFDFFITQQEVYHIFDNYRRNRHAFSVRSSANRALYRYNAKMRDGAKGLGLMANIYRNIGEEEGLGFDTFWPVVAKHNFASNILASSIAFDHFARQLQRPQSGVHTKDPEGIWRSTDDSYFEIPSDAPRLVIPNGAWGDRMGNMQYGGRLLENRLCETCGEYDSYYTMNAGQYYDKLNTAYLMAESVDNFISDSRRDFLDGRYRSVSMADLFPDGYRRWLANNLTGDTFIKGARVAADASGRPLMDADGYPSMGIGWTRWGATTPTVCFQSPYSLGIPDGNGGLQCTTNPPAKTAVLDPQVDWEQHKFLIAYTLLYLPENQQQWWLQQMNIWELGADSDPGFTNRIEFHDPSGKVFIAKTFGKEKIFEKPVQKGIAARVLEYANELMAQAYVTTDGPDLDGDDKPDWYLPVFKSDGTPMVKWDPGVWAVSDQWQGVPKEGCNENDNSKCICSDNRACIKLSKYVELPFFFRQAMAAYGLADPSMRGIW
ncbi:MAG: hypothetical protein ACOX6T_21760 [Myxococcales bacterium]|jgi:hypothetical protein